MGIVEKVARKGRCPVLHDANELPLREMVGRPLFRGERYTGAVDGRLDNEVLIVKDKGSRDGDGDGLVTLVKFPLVDALPMMAEVDAAMTQQVARLRRLSTCSRRSATKLPPNSGRSISAALRT